jgi:hypothetical protein
LEFKEEKNNSNLRLTAGTLMKNLISNNKFLNKWAEINLDIRATIKETVLGCLASPDVIVRRSAANVVATIYKIEYFQNPWNELIDILTSICSNNNEAFKISALMTLGYISQEIPPAEFRIADADKIFGALIGVINDKTVSPKVLQTTMISFVNYLNFAAKNFANEVKFNFNLYKG